eukprot:scaffold628_cov88-Skeletonema_dohrnii-CCMP3373.AAC.1
MAVTLDKVEAGSGASADRYTHTYNKRSDGVMMTDDDRGGYGGGRYMEAENNTGLHLYITTRPRSLK